MKELFFFFFFFFVHFNSTILVMSWFSCDHIMLVNTKNNVFADSINVVHCSFQS